MQQVAERQGYTTSRLIRWAILSYLEKLPLELLFAKKVEFTELFKQLRQFAMTYHVAGIDTTAQREILIKTLMTRIRELSERIEQGKTAKPLMLKQIQLVGYLSLVAAGILEDVATDELFRRLERCEEFAGIGEAKTEDREAPATAGKQASE